MAACQITQYHHRVIGGGTNRADDRIAQRSPGEMDRLAGVAAHAPARKPYAADERSDAHAQNAPANLARKRGATRSTIRESRT